MPDVVYITKEKVDRNLNSLIEPVLDQVDFAAEIFHRIGAGLRTIDTYPDIAV